MGKPDQTKRAKKMLTEAVTLLCRTNLSFSDQMTVEGLVGITLDRQDIILVSINETIKSGSGGSPSPSAKKKKSKKRRRRSTSSEDTEESDEDHGMMGHHGREFPMPGGSFPGVVGPDGQIHPVGAFHGEGYDDEHYGELDPADVEIKDEKFSEEEGECVMVEGEEDEDSKDAAFMKAHEMAYVQGNPAFNQAGPSNVRQFQGKAINQAQHQVQMTPPKVQQQMLKCHLCPKSFKWDKNLQKHLQDEHSGSKVHKCTWCDKVLSSDMSLKRHMKKVHGMNSDGEITCQECGKKITSLPCDFCAMMDYPDEEYDEFEEGELEIPIPLQNQQMMQQQHQQQMKFQMMPNQQPQQPQQQFMVQGKRQNRMPLQQQQQQQQQQGFINQQHQQFNPMMQQQQQFRQGAPQKFGQMPRRMAPQQQPQQQRMMMPRQPQQSGFQQQFQQHVQQRNPQQQQQMPFRGQMMQQQPRQQMQMQRMKQQQQQQQQPGSSPLYIKPEPEWEEGQHFPGQQQQVGQFNPQGQMQGQMPGQMQGQMQGQMGPMQGQQFNLPTGPQQGKKGQHKVQYVPPMQTQTMQSPKPDKSKNEEDNYEEEEEEEPKRKKKKKSKSKKRTPSGAESPSSQQLQPPPPPPPKSNTPKPTDNGSGQEKTAAAPEGAGSAGGAEGSQDLDDMETYIKEEPEWEEAHAH